MFEAEYHLQGQLNFYLELNYNLERNLKVINDNKLAKLANF